MQILVSTLCGVEPWAPLMQGSKTEFVAVSESFMFPLTVEKFNNLKSQNVISSWGGSRVLP
jgi:hypothetical protein